MPTYKSSWIVPAHDLEHHRHLRTDIAAQQIRIVLLHRGPQALHDALALLHVGGTLREVLAWRVCQARQRAPVRIVAAQAPSLATRERDPTQRTNGHLAAVGALSGRQHVVGHDILTDLTEVRPPGIISHLSGGGPGRQRRSSRCSRWRQLVTRMVVCLTC